MTRIPLWDATKVCVVLATRSAILVRARTDDFSSVPVLRARREAAAYTLRVCSASWLCAEIFLISCARRTVRDCDFRDFGAIDVV